MDYYSNYKKYRDRYLQLKNGFQQPVTLNIIDIGTDSLVHGDGTHNGGARSKSKPQAESETRRGRSKPSQHHHRRRSNSSRRGSSKPSQHHHKRRSTSANKRYRFTKSKTRSTITTANKRYRFTKSKTGSKSKSKSASTKKRSKRVPAKKEYSGYTGAGVIIIEQYKNKDKTRDEPAIILFKGTGSQKYNDLGGSIDKKDDTGKYPLATTAAREAFEESRGLIKFTKPTHIGPLFIDKKKYRGHIVAIKPGSLKTEDYQSNRDKLDKKQGIPHIWKETDEIARFYISDLVSKGIFKRGSKRTLNDADGRKRSIGVRSMDIVKEAIDAGHIEAALKYPRKLSKGLSVIHGVEVVTYFTL